MSESSSTSSLADKAAKAAAVGLGAAALAAAVPQDELVKEGFPAFWDAVKGIFAEGWDIARTWHKRARPIVFRWYAKLVSVLKWWILASLALVVMGIEVKSRMGSNVGHVLVAVGTMSFCALGILLFVLADGLSAILYLKLKVAGSVFGKATSLMGVHLPEVIDEADLAKFRNRIRLILAGTTVLCFSLIFTMFFPAWSTLGWTLCFWPLVAVAVLAMFYKNMEPGKAMMVLFYAAIGMLMLMFVVFILDRVTGGSLSFGSFRTWLVSLNASKIVTTLFVLVVLTLLLVSAFVGKDASAAYRQAAKYVGVTLLVSWLGLLYAGTVTWAGLWGKEPPKAIQEVGEKIQNGSIKDISLSPKGEKKAVEPYVPDPARAGSSGVYLAPPSGDAVMPGASAPHVTKPRTKKQPLPDLKPKTYEAADSAVSDLESLL